MRLSLQFVDSVPRKLEPATLYVSVQYATAAHLCCCGCGTEVITPLSPVGWKLIFDGETATLEPSIGNWNLPCRSHYWIVRNTVRWAARWSAAKANLAQERDRRDREQYYLAKDAPAVPSAEAPERTTAAPPTDQALSTEQWLHLRRGHEPPGTSRPADSSKSP